MAADKDQKEAALREALELAAELAQNHDQLVLGALARLLAQRVSLPVGRPPEPDRPLLDQMADWIESGEVDSVRAAAVRVAEYAAGGANSTNIERLRKKYGRQADELVAAARWRVQEREALARFVKEAERERMMRGDDPYSVEGPFSIDDIFSVPIR